MRSPCFGKPLLTFVNASAHGPDCGETGEFAVNFDELVIWKEIRTGAFANA